MANLLSFFSHTHAQSNDRSKAKNFAGGDLGDRFRSNLDCSTNTTNKLLGSSLTAVDRHGGSVQVVSSANGDLTNDDPLTGHSNTPITEQADIDVVSDTKYV